MDYSQDHRQIEQTLNLLYTRNALVASMTIVVLEWFHLFNLEKRLIWPSRWGLAKLLFLINRYMPLLFLPLWLYYNSAPSSTSTQSCQKLFDVATVLVISACLCADALLYFRLLALAEQTKVMRIVLSTIYSVVAVVCLGSISLFLREQTFIPSPNLVPLTTCFNLGSKAGDIWAAVCYGALLCSSLSTASLSLWFGIQMNIKTQPICPSFLKFMKIFHRDGAFYFVCIATISLGNVFMALSTPSQYRYILSVAQGMVHSLLATRMVLQLREVAQDTVLSYTVQTWSTVPRDASRASLPAVAAGAIDTADSSWKPFINLDQW